MGTDLKEATSSELDFVAANIDGRSISLLNERVHKDEEMICHLKDQIRTLTDEKVDMVNYIRSTNEMVAKLCSEVSSTAVALKEAADIHSGAIFKLVDFKASLRAPESFNLEPLQTMDSSFMSSRFMSGTFVEKGTKGHVTVLKERAAKDTLHTLKQENPNYYPYINILMRFTLFASFPRDIMEKVCLSAYEMTRRKGQTIITKGEEGAEIFFILSGVVSIFVEDKELSSLQMPVFFGELGVLFKFKRTATVIAKTDVAMVVVTRQKLDEILATAPLVQAEVEKFSANKEIWWLKQQYASGQEKFGSEFANDIARKNIRKLDLFRDAPDAFVDSLAMTMKCHVVHPGDNIINFGDESQAMYFLLAGTVQVVGETGVVHAEIQQGSFFGEVGVLLNMKRTASIRAKDESYVFEITKENLDSVALSYPLMKEKLQEEAAERFALVQARAKVKGGSIASLPDQFDMEVGESALGKLSLFRGVDQSVIQELAMSMIRKTWEANEIIIQCGDPGDSMFFLAAGTANVITEFDEVIDDVSGPSAYFGEVAIIEQVPRTATIKCTSTCSTYELKKDDVKAVMNKHPDIAHQIKETADARMQKFIRDIMSANLSALSTKLDGQTVPALLEKVQAQEDAIHQLTNTLQLITAERNTQNSMISMLKSTVQGLKKRSTELVKTNREIRGITQVYIAIASQLRERENLSIEEREIVASSERAKLLIQYSGIVTEDDDFDEVASLPRRKSGKNEIRRASVMPGESRSSTVPGDRPVSDITVFESKKSEPIVASSQRNFHEEHPNIPTLVRFPLFASFTQEIIEQVSLASYEMRRRSGQIIVKKGDEGAEIFFLTEGSVSVIVDDKELSVLNAPVFFGELGVLFRIKRSATVLAKTDSTMVVVTKQKLDEIVEAHPSVRNLVESFSLNKETWWKNQQYVSGQAQFGAEFARDLARADIKKLAIFANAPDAFVDSLATSIKCLVYEPNTNIISIDEESDAMYFILDGTVEVVGSTGSVHAEMSHGAFFGEVGVLLDMKRTASIRAKVQSHVFKLAKEDLDRVTRDFPSMKTILKEAADERYQMFKQRTSVVSGGNKTEGDAHVPDQFDMEVAGQSLAKLSLFERVDKSVLSELAMKMIRKTWEKEEKIIVCNAAGNSMFFLAAGNADVITDFGEVIDKVSGPSAYFGEVAIIEQVPRTATVKCTSTCSTYELRKDDFKSVIGKYPQIVAQIKNTADERMQNYLMRSVLA
ncbi:hypothetical protein HDU98_006297 [Podochytrium sp. JEL0797]|nr:hypothetical protein HDU98_006297 [Podochytrium sp. JEL0797]